MLMLAQTENEFCSSSYELIPLNKKFSFNTRKTLKRESKRSTRERKAKEKMY